MDTKTLCLGVLSMGDASGYDIRKTLEEVFSHFFVAGFGSIYPALADLERRGLVVCRSQVVERGPPKKTYALTEAGWRALRQALALEPPRHKIRSEFMVLTFFSALLEAPRVTEVLDERRADLEHKRGIVEAVLARDDLTPGMRFTAGYGKAVIDASLDFIIRHRHELEGGMPRSE